MRVWNKPLKEINGKELFLLYMLFQMYKGINRGFGYSKSGQQLQKWVDKQREEKH